MEVDRGILGRRVPPAMLGAGPARTHHRPAPAVGQSAMQQTGSASVARSASPMRRTEIPGRQHPRITRKVRRRQYRVPVRPCVHRSRQHRRRFDLPVIRLAPRIFRADQHRSLLRRRRHLRDDRRTAVQTLLSHDQIAGRGRSTSAIPRALSQPHARRERPLTNPIRSDAQSDRPLDSTTCALSIPGQTNAVHVRSAAGSQGGPCATMPYW